MDKGYDSEEIHELIRDTLNSCSLIPVRNRKRKRISGYYRRRIAQSFDPERYHQRNKVETVFSVMKRKFGESIKARKYRLQIKEIKIKVILHNLTRMISTFSFLILIEEFFRASHRIIKKGFWKGVPVLLGTVSYVIQRWEIQGNQIFTIMTYNNDQLKILLNDIIINVYGKSPIILLDLWDDKGEKNYIDFLHSQYENILIDFNKIYKRLFW